MALRGEGSLRNWMNVNAMGMAHVTGPELCGALSRGFDGSMMISWFRTPTRVGWLLKFQLQN